jgi:hypothetical protein
MSRGPTPVDESTNLERLPPEVRRLVEAADVEHVDWYAGRLNDSNGAGRRRHHAPRDGDTESAEQAAVPPHGAASKRAPAADA